MDWTAVVLSLRLAAIVCAVVLVVGLPIAYWLTFSSWRWKFLIESVVALPLVLPPTVLGFYVLVALGSRSPIGRAWTAWTGHGLAFTFEALVVASILYSLPFGVQPIASAFAQVDRTLLEASATLGAGRLRTFIRMILPLSAEGIIAGGVLTFAHTLGEFGVVLMVGGNLPGVTRTVSIAIYDDVQSLDMAAAHETALVLLAFSFAALSVVYALVRKPVGRGAAVMRLTVCVRTRLSASFALDVAFEAAPGVTIVFGESGSGKTTLLRNVAGLARPDAGTIMVGDRVLLDTRADVDVDPSRRRAGYVFQHLALFPHLSAADNITYGLVHLAAPERRARTTAVAESFRIGHLLDRRPAKISGGERQRVALARLLVTDPDILLLDEPLSALDYVTQSRILADLRRWNDARGIPILYVTHSQREVFALGERVLVLQEGRIVADGSPQQVMEAPSHEGVARLAGFENILDAVVVDRRPDTGVMLSRLAGTNVDLEVPLGDAHQGQKVRVAVRAGDVMIATVRPHGLSARNVIAGMIASLTRQGAVVRVTVNVGVPIDAFVTPTATEALDLRAGRKVWIVIKTHSCHLVGAP